MAFNAIKFPSSIFQFRKAIAHEVDKEVFNEKATLGYGQAIDRIVLVIFLIKVGIPK